MSEPKTPDSETTTPDVTAASARSRDLLPCPFCGEDPAIEDVGYTKEFYVVSCDNIRCPVDVSASGFTTKEAANEWNTRAKG